jgi:hypothetical protein
MRTQAMTMPHQPWAWPLGRAEARRLAAKPATRWLQVTAGRVWLTESGAGPASDDVWLREGESHLLPAGSEWVVEGWPEATVELLEAPQ